MAGEGRDVSHELILCTKDRPSSVRTCMEHVIAADDRPGRVVIVDASSDRRTQAIASEVAGNVPDLEIVYVRAAPGLTRQRNLGIEAATSEIIHFLDDDAYVHRQYFSEILGAFALSGRAAVGVGGLQSSVFPPRRAWIRRLFGLYGRPGSVTKAAVNIEGDSRVTRLMGVEWLSGCAMSFRRRVAQDNRFDENLDGYALGEDLEFCLRVGQRGALLLQPSAVVDHRREDLGSAKLRKLAKDDITHRWYFVRKMPERFSVAAFVWSLVGLFTIRSARMLLRPSVVTAGQWLGTVQGVMSIVLGPQCPHFT